MPGLFNGYSHTQFNGVSQPSKIEAPIRNAKDTPIAKLLDALKAWAERP
jgi:hypothetical protein